MKSKILKIMIAVAMTISSYARAQGPLPSTSSNSPFSMEHISTELNKMIHQMNQQGVQVFDSSGSRINLSGLSLGQYHNLSPNSEFRVRTELSSQGQKAREYIVQLLPQHESTPSVQRFLIKTTSQNFHTVQNRAVLSYDANLSYQENQENMRSAFQRLSFDDGGSQESSEKKKSALSDYERKRIESCSGIGFSSVLAIAGAIVMLVSFYRKNTPDFIPAIGFLAVLAGMIGNADCRPAAL